MKFFIIILFVDMLKHYLGSERTGDVFVVEKEANKKKMVIKSRKVDIKGTKEYKMTLK
jgi:hypothetical protein